MADNTPIKWAYPFPAKPTSTGSSASDTSNPELYFQALAKAKDGFYPMGASGLWHGGVHFDEGTATCLDQSEVKCIADGEVIAYRIDEQYPRTTYGEGPTAVHLPFSTGFVLVKHLLKFPALPVEPSTDEAAVTTPTATPELTFYSLYMHLLDWAGYQAQPSMKRPSFWGNGLCKVKADAPDKLQGLNVRAHYKVALGHADRSAYENILATLPRGTIVEAEGGPEAEHDNWIKLSSITPAIDGLEPSNCWAYKPEMKSLGDSRYLVSEGAKDPIAPTQQGLNVRSARSKGDIIAFLPVGAQLRISSDGAASKYRKLEEIISGAPVPALSADSSGKLPGYVWLGSLETSNEPKAHDGSVVVLDQPVAIKAGELIGHIGQYQNFDDARPRSVLHLQTFTCDDLPAFIEQCRSLAEKLPDDQKTLIKVHVDTKMAQAPAADSTVAAEQNVRLCSDSPKEGCWAKVQQYVELKAKKAGFGAYDSAKNCYPMDAAKKAELASEFGLAEDELPDSAEFLLESYKDDGSDMHSGKSGIPATHVRRKVGLRLKTPLWVQRSQLSENGQRVSTSGELPAWKDFPLSNGLDGKLCGYERILPRASWSSLDHQHKAIAPDNIRWWYVNVADASGKDISGWAPELDPIITLHSPWEWPGFTSIEDHQPLDAQLARQLNAEGSLRGSEPERYQTKIDATERGLVLSKLYEIIDLPGTDNRKDGKLTAEEIRAALGKPWLAQQLSQLVTKYESEWFWSEGKWSALDELLTPNLEQKNANWESEKKRIETLSWWKSLDEKLAESAIGKIWHIHPLGLVNKFQNKIRCYCYEQGIVDAPCMQGIQDVTKDHFESLATQLNVEREVLRAIAVAETGDKSPFKEFVPGERHARILYERHYMRRLLLKSGMTHSQINNLSTTEPKIVHAYESNYSYGTEQQQYERLKRARELNFDAANMSCSWGKFQVMGEYYTHLYKSTQELVDAQNFCALQHLQYFKVFLTEEKKMLNSMQSKNWTSIAEKYNGLNQIGYDVKIENAYNDLKESW